MINTLERFHVYNVTRLDNQITDKGTAKYNVIFDTTVQRNSQRAFTSITPSLKH
jgi:hypothetical protein